MEENGDPIAIGGTVDPSRRAPRERSVATFLLLLTVLVAACAESRKPALPKRAVRTSSMENQPGAAASPPSSTTASPYAQGAGIAPTPPVTIVIDDPTPEAAEPSLLEASRLARERRETARPPVAVITNQNLAEYAKRGNLTVVQPPAKALPEDAATDEAEPEVAAPPVKDEIYWRNGVRELREKWRQVADELADLQEKAATLRQQFYSEDDPYYRDSRIKPAWDRVLDRLTEAKTEVEQEREKLDAFLEDGRKSEALPGWLREGIELEPDHQPEPSTKDLRSTDATEPVIVNEDPPQP